MMEIVNLFREKGTLDELGIGTIRDTLAEHFFPGINTIQTRARYFLFVPWIYEALEAQRTSTGQISRKAREQQAQLVEALKKGGVGASSGLIGIDAGINIQRTPSAIYWGGLGRWGIRTLNGSMDDYHGSLDAHYREERQARIADGGELVNEARRNWHPSLPPAPADLMESTTFALSAAEADFLLERIRQNTAGSLLAAVTGYSPRRIKAAGYAWDLPGVADLDPVLSADLRHARNFSKLLEGAHLLYHLMLSEAVAERTRPDAPKWVEQYAKQLAQWADEVQGQLEELRVWDRAEFRFRMSAINPRIHSRVWRFVLRWMDEAVADPRAIRTNELARDLVRGREHETKTSLARLANPKALERYDGGPGGNFRLSFRWTGVKQIVGDILEGAAMPVEAP